MVAMARAVQKSVKREQKNDQVRDMNEIIDTMRKNPEKIAALKTVSLETLSSVTLLQHPHSFSKCFMMCAKILSRSLETLQIEPSETV